MNRLSVSWTWVATTASLTSANQVLSGNTVVVMVTYGELQEPEEDHPERLERDLEKRLRAAAQIGLRPRILFQIGHLAYGELFDRQASER